MTLEPDFGTDIGPPVGSCQACKNGRHSECVSVRIESGEDDPYPYFADENRGPVGPERVSDWRCGCLEAAEAANNHDKHGWWE